MPSIGRRRRHHGQSLVEFTLVAPLLFLIMAVTIDFARVVYVYGAISSITREGARLLSLADQATTDCVVLQRLEANGGGFVLSADPNSQFGNSFPANPSPPLAPTAPQPGQGFIYLWPAVATGNPPDSPSNCGGTGSPRLQASGPRDVAVEVQYGFRPWISVVADFIPNFTIKTVSVVHAEYQ